MDADEGLIRLLALADFLECDVMAAQGRSGRKKLRMERWFDAGKTGLKRPSLERDGCGTSACALGWATVAFSESKLRVSFEPCNCTSTCNLKTETIRLGEAEGMEAAREFFGIRFHEATALFTSRAGKSITAVVRNFREFVARKWEEADGRQAV